MRSTQLQLREQFKLQIARRRTDIAFGVDEQLRRYVPEPYPGAL